MNIGINLGLHPNIVSCYYVREIGGVPTIFSEWMDNGSLKDRIKDGSLYEGTEKEVQRLILDIAIQTARGFKYSHENNLIHQDVKPGNILLTKNWEVKVADFGLAKAQSQLQDRLKPVFTGCTLEYCPKEQAEGTEAEKWMDVYAWALTVLEMFAGKRLWTSGAEAKEHCTEYFAQCRIPITKAVSKMINDCLSGSIKDFSDIETILVKEYQNSNGVGYPRSTSIAAPDTADYLNNKALSFLDLGKAKDAEKLWEKALDKESDHPFSLFNAGLFKWRKGSITNLEFQQVLEKVRGGTGGQAYQDFLQCEKFEEGRWKDLGESIFSSEEELIENVINVRYSDAVYCKYDIYSYPLWKKSEPTFDLRDDHHSISYIKSERSLVKDYYLVRIIEKRTGRIITSIDCSIHTMENNDSVSILGVYALFIGQDSFRIAVVLRNNGYDRFHDVLKGFYVEEFEVSLGDKTEYKLSVIETTESLLEEEKKIKIILEQTEEHIKKRRYREAMSTLNKAREFDRAVYQPEYRTFISEIGMKCAKGKIRQIVRIQEFEDSAKRERLCFVDCFHMICWDRRSQKYFLEDVRDASSKLLEIEKAAQEDIDRATGKHFVSARFDERECVCHVIYWDEENKKLMEMTSVRLHTRASENDYIQSHLTPAGFCLMPSEHYLAYVINGLIFVHTVSGGALDYTSFNTEEFGSGGQELKRQISAICPSIFSDSLYVVGGRNGVYQFENDSLILRLSVEPESVGKQMQRIKVPEDILAITQSPDGKVLAVGTRSGKILLLDVKTGSVVFEVLETSADAAYYDTYKLSFSSDGNYLLAGKALYFIERELIYHEPTDCTDEVLPFFDLFLRQGMVVSMDRRIRLYNQLAAAGYGYFNTNSVYDMLLDYKMRKLRQKTLFGRMVNLFLDHRKKRYEYRGGCFGKHYAEQLNWESKLLISENRFCENN